MYGTRHRRTGTATAPNPRPGRRTGSGVGGGVPPYLPTIIISCFANFLWLAGDTLHSESSIYVPGNQPRRHRLDHSHFTLRAMSCLLGRLHPLLGIRNRTSYHRSPRCTNGTGYSRDAQRQGKTISIAPALLRPTHLFVMPSPGIHFIYLQGHSPTSLALHASRHEFGTSSDISINSVHESDVFHRFNQLPAEVNSLDASQYAVVPSTPQYAVVLSTPPGYASHDGRARSSLYHLRPKRISMMSASTGCDDVPRDVGFLGHDVAPALRQQGGVRDVE
ncbi:hypothetical protein C8R44DRAFT_735046 [Mycena epipterygia]|nr:hypothetical protein C8R44DRAFT_735046 [Mycena epipterygia]